MSDEKLKIEEETLTDEPLSSEEEAEIDRILKMASAEDDAKVDYKAIHDAVIEKARGEGIALFPTQRTGKRKKTLWRVLTGVGAAAAVFVVGFFAISLIDRSFTSLGRSNSFDAPHEVDNLGSKDAYVPTSAPSSEPASETGMPSSADPTVIIDIPATADPTFPAKGEVLTTPLPTDCLNNSAKVGYVLVCPFTTDPVDPSELLPELPGSYEAEFIGTELYASAEGVYNGSEYYYKCFVSRFYFSDASLGVGVARMTVEETGLIHFIWRVTEDCRLEVYFEGFTETEAIALLKTLPLCDRYAFGETA